jgi:hypothetical protein
MYPKFRDENLFENFSAKKEFCKIDPSSAEVPSYPPTTRRRTGTGMYGAFAETVCWMLIRKEERDPTFCWSRPQISETSFVHFGSDGAVDPPCQNDCGRSNGYGVGILKRSLHVAV